MNPAAPHCEVRERPENILIDSKGRVKIADFGLANLIAGSTDEFTLTRAHRVMGTPRYMAPEQMEGSHSVDHRADIFSLGVVFYEMLTGTVPALSSFLNQQARADYRLVAGNTDCTTDHVTSPHEDAALWLHRGAVVLGCSAAVTLAMLAGVIDSPVRVVKGDEEFHFTLCAIQVLCFSLAVAAFIAASGLRQQRQQARKRQQAVAA